MLYVFSIDSSFCSDKIVETFLCDCLDKIGKIFEVVILKDNIFNRLRVAVIMII